mmetsp:Transcript_18926/g.32808  ORF Transcript_18926/g.32808 Transcript_18926/m.32808 type:complete len:145 (+) Transcript_18926:171-605(+)
MASPLRNLMIILVIMGCLAVCYARTYNVDGVEITSVNRPEQCEGAKEGDKLKVHYRLALKDNPSSTIDSSYDRKTPFDFTLGRGTIKGWTIGMTDACKGEKRTLVIPSDLGYGDRGAGGRIPGKATLLFEIELLDIVRGTKNEL